MTYNNLLLQAKDNILTIIIDRESKLNAINRETLDEIYQAFKTASGDSTVRGIIITGQGTKSFVAGADISEFTSLDPSEGEKLALRGHEVFDMIADSVKPVIAAINGYAFGGGLELALACHIRIASENAQMGLPELSLGLIPGYGGTQRLALITGKAKALELILTSARIGAVEAHRIGIVNKVVPADELMQHSNELMKKIIDGPHRAIAGAIAAVDAAFKKDTDGFKTEIAQFAECFRTEDFKEGARAFMEKRKPIFNREE